MSEPSSKTKLVDSPFRLLAIVAASVFVSEALVMVLLIILPPLPHTVAAPLDAILVTILIYPILYRFMLRPMAQHLNERRQAEAALLQIQDDLELRVQQRTAELAQANESLQAEIVERQHAGEELKAALDLVQQRQVEMAGLLTGARAVLEYRDFSQVAQAIFEACRSTIGATAGYVALPTEDRSGEMPVYSAAGERAGERAGEWAGERAAAEPMPMAGLRDQAYSSRKTLYQNEYGHTEDAPSPPAGHLLVQNILCAPMTIRGFVVGTIGLANKPGGFSDDDARLATAFAELAAVAVLNSQTIELLESSEQRFRTLAQATFEGILISEGGIVREANEQFAQTYGYPLSGVMGRPVTDFLTWQPLNQATPPDTWNDDQIEEFQAVRKDGSTVLLEARGRMIERGGQVMRVIAIRDITERKRAEQMLRENEEWLRLAFDAGDLGRWRFSVATGMLHFDERARVHSGASETVVSQAEALTYVHPDDRALLQKETLQALDPAGNGRYAAEYRVCGPSGAWHWLAVQARVHFEGEGPARQPVLAVGVSQDITSRKQAEKALRESRRDLDRAQEVGQIGSWRLDVRHDVLTWSDENHRIFGVPAGTPMTYETFLGSVHPDDREYVDRRWAAGLAGEPYDIEHRIIAAGAIKWVREKAYLEFDQDGALVAGFGITQDITERKRAEEQLRTTLESIGDGFFACDADWRFVYVNAPAERIMGMRREEVLGRKFWDVFLLTVGTNLEREYRRAAAGEIRDFENFFEPWGRWFHNRCFPREGGGMSVYFEDITGRKQTEDRVNWLATFPELNPNPVVEVDLTGNIRYLNPAAQRLLPGLETEGLAHPWLADLVLLGQTLQSDNAAVVTREIEFDQAVYQQSLYYVPDAQRVRIYSLDITARKQAEEQLRLLSTALEAAANGVVITDLQGNILWVNPGFTALTGYTREEALGKNPRVLKSGQHHAEYYQQLWGTILRGQPWSGEIVNRRKDGTLYYEEMTITPVRAEGRDITHFVAIKEDITARKQAEETLERQSQELRMAWGEAENEKRRLEAVMDALPIGVAITDINGGSLQANRAYDRLWGDPRPEPQSVDDYAAYQAWWPATGQVVAPEEWASAQVVQKNEAVVGQMLEIQRFDGSRAFVINSASPVRDASGQLVGSVVAIQDITDLKRAEAALRASENRYRNLVELSPEAIFVNRNNCLEFVNPAMLALCGATEPAQLLGKSPFDFFHPDYHAIMDDRIDRVLGGQSVQLLEEKIVRLDGAVRDIEAVTSLFVDQAGPALQVMLRDITERKQREAKLRQLNRTLKALSRSSQAMLRAQSESAYLAEVCQIIVDDCGYRMVWIGLAENDADQTVRPAAYAGFEAGYLETLGITWADTPRGRGPTGMAIRTGRISRCHNMLTDPNFAPWREDALKRGYASSIVFPLAADDRVFGAITIYSPAPDAFTAGEAELLGNLANDLAYGITTLRTRAARAQAEAALRYAHDALELRVLERTAELATANKELRLQSAALQAAANGIIITDPSGNIQWANSAFAAMTGYPLSEVVGQNMRLLKSTEQAPEFYRQLWETILSGQVWQGELINCRKDGSVYVEEQTIAPVLSEAGRIINFIAVKQDITERKRAEARLTQYNRELLALGNAERRARQMAETLAAASLALTQSLDLEAVMETLLDYMFQLVPYDSANVMLLETEERLVVRAARGYEKWTQTNLTRAIAFDAHSNPIFDRLLSQKKSILIPDTRADPAWDVRPGAEHVRSWIGVPIVAGGHVIGIYSLDMTFPDFFNAEHVQLAESLVGQAAVAIQNAWLFDQLRAGRERLQSLSRRLVEVQEAERHYVARELHDEAGQALTSLVYALGELERETVPDKRALRLADLKKTTHEILENLHHLAMELRPASLDFLGLVPALNQYVKATGERYGLNAQFKVIGLTEERLPSAMETALYRIVQEALTNVIRHAQATRVDVLLERRGEQVVLVVEDNGRGFAANLAQQAQTGHLGLVGMQERAEMLNGTLVIESTPDTGTTIVIEVPYDPTNSDRG